MGFPFSSEQFFEILKYYNGLRLPMQLAFCGLALLTVLSIWRQKSYANKLAGFILTFLWTWIGLTYVVIFFLASHLSISYNLSLLHALFFVTQGTLLFNYAIRNNSMRLVFQKNINSYFGIILIIYSIIPHHLLNIYLGHPWPVTPAFGIPCLITIFTFGLFLQSQRYFPAYLLIIPLLFSVIGFIETVFSIPRPDVILLFSSIITCVLIIIKNKLLTPTLRRQN